MNLDRLRGLIGLSRRAGQLLLGTDTVLRTLKGKECSLVLLDEAAAPNTKKRLREAAARSGVPVFRLPEGLLDEAAGQSGKIMAAVRAGSLADQIGSLFETAEKA